MRDNLLICVTGRKRVGKSYESLKQLLYYAYLSQYRKKALIFDVNNEYGGYEIDGKIHKIKEIRENDLLKYSNFKGGEVRRIVPVHPNGMPMDDEETERLLLSVIKFFRGGILMVDDLNVVFGDALPVKFSSLLCNNAHRACDIILQIQSVGRLVPKLRQNINIIRMHQQLDDLDDSKNKLAGDYKILKIAQLMINRAVKDGSPRFFVNIFRDDGVIRGAFSPRMLATAIQDFIMENPSELSSLQQRRDGRGKKLYGYEQALAIKVREMYELFNGNK